MPCAAASTPTLSGICNRIPEIPLIYGGPLTSIPHQNWIFFKILNADAVIPGDGEHALAMLLERIRDKKGIENTMGVITNPKEKIQLNTIQNLNKLPFPARDLFPLSQYKLSVRRELFVNPFANMVVTRGCPFSCPFCLSGTLNNCQRRRSIENILCEIKFLKERYGVRSIVFYDDMIFPNKSTVNEDVKFFSESIFSNYQGSLLWQIEFRPELLCELEDVVLKKMVNAGCRQLNVGFEKGYEKGIREFGKKYNLDEVKEVSKNIRKKHPKLRLAGTFIIGSPNEKKDEALQTIEYSKDVNLLYAHFNPLKLYPGTKFYNKKFGEKSRYWYEVAMKENNLSCDLICENSELTTNAIFDLISYAYDSFYDRDDWKKLSHNILGSHINEIDKIIKSWSKNRLQGYLD